jgi:hypothetical protein
LILNFLSEIDYLATNQGVVGSNPAGRAISAFVRTGHIGDGSYLRHR